MIGQHIYSRCTEGYFSRSGSKGDSTTVTISRDMFAREDQAKLVARECEAVGTLEDIRPVPSEITGTYRGVLKIKRLNQQLTVVSRAYRLKAEGNMSGERSSGEFRDFTYSSSYILAEEDKGRFLREPEYALNLQNFEPYPSVQARIEESKRNGARGRIEANPEYSLVLHRNFLLIISAALSRELDIWITGAMRMTKFWLYCQISSALHGMQPVEMVMLSRSLRQL